MCQAVGEEYLRSMHRRILSAVLVLVACTAQAQFEKAEATVRKALADGKPYKAIAKAESALSKKDAPTVFHVLRADGYNRIGSYAKALKDAKAAQPLLGDDLELRSQFVGAYLGLDLPDSALNFFGDAKRTDPRIEETFVFRMGSTYERLGAWRDAVEIFDEGVKAFPDSPRMLRERGSCHAMLGDSAKARVDLDRAIELAPRDAVNYNSRGFYRYALFGDHAHAVADMDRAIKQDPNYGYAFSNRGWSRYKLGEVDKAKKDLLLALKKNPENAYAYRSLGVIGIETGEIDRGCERLHDALKHGFAKRYGTEVEELINVHCGTTVPVVEPVPVIAPVAPANAPGGRTSPPGNAP